MRDTAGRPWLTVAEAQPGARIQADGEFTFISRNATRTIQSDADWLWIDCRAGQHFLDGQLSADGTHYIGLYLVVSDG